MLELHSFYCFAVSAWGVQMPHCIPSCYATIPFFGNLDAINKGGKYSIGELTLLVHCLY